jgi:hypothetical protein
MIEQEASIDRPIVRLWGQVADRSRVVRGPEHTASARPGEEGKDGTAFQIQRERPTPMRPTLECADLTQCRRRWRARTTLVHSGVHLTGSDARRPNAGKQCARVEHPWLE